MNSVLLETELPLAKEFLANTEVFALWVLEHLAYTNWELSIMLASPDTIQHLNKEYREKDYSTDVLSFPQLEPGEALPEGEETFVAGDLVLSLENIQANAQEFEQSFDNEYKRVIIHGILHLSGYDHESNDAEEPMLLLQEEILGKYPGEIQFSL